MPVSAHLRTICIALTLVPAPAFAQQTSPFGESIADYGGAELLNKDWFREYPPAAILNNIEGRVTISFDITAEGRAENCEVTVSSGYRALDDAPCRSLERKARFTPAKAEDGSPRPTSGRLSIDFWLH